MNLKLQFQKLNTPTELSEFLSHNIKYGWIGKDNIIRVSTISDFRSQFQLSSLDKTLEIGVGTCFEQVEIARDFFNKHNIQSTSYAIIGGRMIHTFIVFIINGLYYKLESADFRRAGIFEYSTLEELLKQELHHFMVYRRLETIDKVNLVEYDKLSESIDYNGIVDKLKNSKNIICDVLAENGEMPHQYS